MLAARSLSTIESKLFRHFISSYHPNQRGGNIHLTRTDHIIDITVGYGPERIAVNRFSGLLEKVEKLPVYSVIHKQCFHTTTAAMGKKSKSIPIPEETLQLLTPPTSYPIVDTHTHLHSTFEAYKKTYPDGKYKDAWEFVRGLYEGRNIEAVVDVWCEAPVLKDAWKALADSADKKELWAPLVLSGRRQFNALPPCLLKVPSQGNTRGGW